MLQRFKEKKKPSLVGEGKNNQGCVIDTQGQLKYQVKMNEYAG